MKRCTLSLLLLLVASAANAGEVFYTFPGPTGLTPVEQIGTVNGTGLSLTFGEGWARVADADQNPPLDWMLQQPWGTSVGSYANEPSDNGAGTRDYNVKNPNIEITCSVPVRYVEFWYTGNHRNCFHDGAFCYEFGGTLPIKLSARNAQYQWETFWTPAGETGIDEECWDVASPSSCDQYHAEGIPGASDPTGHLRVWRKFTATFAQPRTVLQIGASHAVMMRWYIDDLKVSTVVPSPPCPPPCEDEVRLRKAQREGKLHITPVTATSWGALKILYR
jgi:hypothetical protein